MNVPSKPAFPRLQRATVQDADRLADLAARLFEWTYRGQDDPQDLATYIQEKFTPAAMARTLTDPNAVILMAEAESGLCGYAHLQLESAAPEVVVAHPAELVRLYVDPSWFGQGLGAALLEAVLATAVREGADILWLIVYHRNSRAKAFYTKHGFQSVGRREFRVGAATTLDDVLTRAVSAPMSGQPHHLFKEL
jgi:ribosomal protein S18 acetylase RimI-like enzyme